LPPITHRTGSSVFLSSDPDAPFLLTTFPIACRSPPDSPVRWPRPRPRRRRLPAWRSQLHQIRGVPQGVLCEALFRTHSWSWMEITHLCHSLHIVLVHLFFFPPTPMPPFSSRPFPSRAAPLPTPPCGGLDRGLAGAASLRGAPQREGRDRGLADVASRGRSHLPHAEVLGRSLARCRHSAWSSPTRGPSTASTTTRRWPLGASLAVASVTVSASGGIRRPGLRVVGVI
jgi:hypothetical protein